MKKPLSNCIVAGLLLCFALAAGRAAEPVWEVKALAKDGEFEFDPETKIVTATKGVQVNYGGAELTATRVTLNQETGDIQAEGLVTLLRDNQFWRGERLEYNFKTKVIKAEDFKTGHAPFFVTGIGLRADQTNRVHSAIEAQITTDDLAEPGYKIRARTLILVPGQSFEARNATVYLGNVPVFYWPRYSRTFGRHPNNFEFTPGFRNVYGPYLLGTYNWYASDKLSGGVHLDYRQKRGLGFGPDFSYDLGLWGKGELLTYYTRDDVPGTNSLNQPLDDKRHRISFSHQATLRTNLTANLVVREQSDPFVIRDFFEQEYRRNIQPSTFLEINQLWQNFSLNVLAQPQVNDFFDTVERLPDVKLTGERQQIGVTPVFYESESSAGYYRHQFADNSKPEFAAWRADSYHQLLLPYTFFGWLNVSPRVGGRFTHYGDTEGPGFTTTEKNRAVLNTGAEVTFKASRVWAGAQSKFWDVQ
jgi:LPS-assembly protein